MLQSVLDFQIMTPGRPPALAHLISGLKEHMIAAVCINVAFIFMSVVMKNESGLAWSWLTYLSSQMKINSTTY